MSDALFKATVRLAHAKPALRKHLLPLLKEAKGEVPEAFKEQWKNKDKDGDGKTNEPKPDFLKEKEKKEEKKAFRAATIRLAYENPKLRPHLLPLLASKVPEAFKEQWEKNKGKGKDTEDDDKPDFLKKKEKKAAFDPHEIADRELGPLKSDSGEPYMKGQFTEQEFEELRQKQQGGNLSQADKAASDEEETSKGPKKGPGGAMLEFLKHWGDDLVRNPETGRDVKLKSLSSKPKGSPGRAIFDRHFQKWHATKKEMDKKKSEKPAFKGASLRAATIRLAHSKPHLRKHLLPLLQD